jgi:hypothetical protein
MAARCLGLAVRFVPRFLVVLLLGAWLGIDDAVVLDRALERPERRRRLLELMPRRAEVLGRSAV